MTEHTGRHASSQDQNETLIMPAIPGQEQPAEAHRAAGRALLGRQRRGGRPEARLAGAGERQHLG